MFSDLGAERKRCSRNQRLHSDVEGPDYSRGRSPRPLVRRILFEPDNAPVGIAQIRCANSRLCLPIAVSFMGADLQTGFALLVSLELFRQPLKPFKRFLRSAAFPFKFNVTPQL